MARLTDNFGQMLGGLTVQTAAISGTEKIKANAFDALECSPQSVTALTWDAHEVVFGLECSRGTFAYHASDTPGGDYQPAVCHNLVEEPGERHHCAQCGGDYCAAHAEIAFHECKQVIPV